MLILCFYFLLLSCTKDENLENEAQDDNLPFLTKETRYTMESGTEHVYITSYFYDDFSRLRKMANSNSSLKSGIQTEFEYNSDGALNKMYIDNKLVNIFYYENDKLTKVLYDTDTDNEFSDTLYIIYDNSGLLIKTIFSYKYDDYTNKKYVYDYIFDSNGNIINKKGYDEQGLNNYEFKYIYSSNGNLLSTNVISDDILISEFSEFEYDNRLNYWRLKHFPKEYIFLGKLNPDNDYNINNIIAYSNIKYYDGWSSYYSYNREITYNSTGYPILIVTNSDTRLELDYSETKP